jgi:hypothetical protein
MRGGLVDANLGGGVFKKRVAISSQGKRSSIRTVIAYQLKGNVFFIYGFAKNQRDNVSSKELKALRLLAKELLSSERQAIDLAVKKGKLIEVVHYEK